MRITNNMMSDTFLSDMNSNLEKLRTLEKQRTSGKNFSKPSDDPANVIRSMQLHSGIDANKQYNKNINSTTNWLDITDTTLDQFGKQLGKIQERLVAAGDGAYSETEMRSIKYEINETIANMSQILNKTFDGRYIFSGTRVTSKPVGINVDANGNKKLNYVDKNGREIQKANQNDGNDQFKILKEKLKVETSQGVVMDYNVNITDILGYNGGTSDLQELLNNIVNHLDGSENDTRDPKATAEDKQKNYTKLFNEDLEAIQKATDHLLKLRSEVGAKQNRMEDAEKINKETNFNMTKILSHTEDIDLVEKTMEFAVLQSVYIASLQTSAKVLQPTLMDYMR